MSDGNALDQDEIERLLGGGKRTDAPKPAESPPPPASSDSGILSQSELDALFGGASPSPAPAAPPPPAPPSSGVLSQAELDLLLGTKPAAGSPPPQPKKTTAPPAAPPRVSQPLAPAVAEQEEEDENYVGIPHGDIDFILDRSENTLRSVASSNLGLPAEVIEFSFPEFGGTVPSTEHTTLDQISEVELDVKIELGRTNMYLEHILQLRKGSVVPLDKVAGEAVDIYVNDRLIARGEVLVMNENFCVRVAELLAGAIPME
ncbi:MAG: flagellar motor switch protein FliN [Planctomycetaceae bacterium]|nr:flagellar motor switch protein FliN [Planctomycetaceae bacterium]